MGTKLYDLDGNELPEPKICPLTKEELDPICDWDCLYADCRYVDEHSGYYLYGRTYRCSKERKEIIAWHESRVKAAQTYKRLKGSLEAARKINVDEFFDYCNTLDEEMLNGRQRYDRDMVINPYHAQDEKCLIYMFENDEVYEISTAKNPFSFLAARFDKISDETKNCGFSICSVPEYMAEAINVRLHLVRNMDVATILHNDNPVYIKARHIGKYIESAYGWDWLSFKRVRDKHLELTEIVNYDNILYIKQELDEIIMREYPRDKD